MSALWSDVTSGDEALSPSDVTPFDDTLSPASDVTPHDNAGLAHMWGETTTDRRKGSNNDLNSSLWKPRNNNLTTWDATFDSNTTSDPSLAKVVLDDVGDQWTIQTDLISKLGNTAHTQTTALDNSVNTTNMLPNQTGNHVVSSPKKGAKTLSKLLLVNPSDDIWFSAEPLRASPVVFETKRTESLFGGEDFVNTWGEAKTEDDFTFDDGSEDLGKFRTVGVRAGGEEDLWSGVGARAFPNDPKTGNQELLERHVADLALARPKRKYLKPVFSSSVESIPELEEKSSKNSMERPQKVSNHDSSCEFPEPPAVVDGMDQASSVENFDSETADESDSLPPPPFEKLLSIESRSDSLPDPPELWGDDPEPSSALFDLTLDTNPDAQSEEILPPALQGFNAKASESEQFLKTSSWNPFADFDYTTSNLKDETFNPFDDFVPKDRESVPPTKHSTSMISEQDSLVDEVFSPNPFNPFETNPFISFQNETDDTTSSPALGEPIIGTNCNLIDLSEKVQCLDSPDTERLSPNDQRNEIILEIDNELSQDNFKTDNDTTDDIDSSVYSKVECDEPSESAQDRFENRISYPEESPKQNIECMHFESQDPVVEVALVDVRDAVTNATSIAEEAATVQAPSDLVIPVKHASPDHFTRTNLGKSYSASNILDLKSDQDSGLNEFSSILAFRTEDVGGSTAWRAIDFVSGELEPVESERRTVHFEDVEPVHNSRSPETVVEEKKDSPKKEKKTKKLSFFSKKDKNKEKGKENEKTKKGFFHFLYHRKTNTESIRKTVSNPDLSPSKTSNKMKNVINFHPVNLSDDDLTEPKNPKRHKKFRTLPILKPKPKRPRISAPILSHPIVLTRTFESESCVDDTMEDDLDDCTYVLRVRDPKSEGVPERVKYYSVRTIQEKERPKVQELFLKEDELPQEKQEKKAENKKRILKALKKSQISPKRSSSVEKVDPQKQSDDDHAADTEVANLTTHWDDLKSRIQEIKQLQEDEKNREIVIAPKISKWKTVADRVSSGQFNNDNPWDFVKRNLNDLKQDSVQPLPVEIVVSDTHTSPSTTFNTFHPRKPQKRVVKRHSFNRVPNTNPYVRATSEVNVETGNESMLATVVKVSPVPENEHENFSAPGDDHLNVMVDAVDVDGGRVNNNDVTVANDVDEDLRPKRLVQVEPSGERMVEIGDNQSLTDC